MKILIALTVALYLLFAGFSDCSAQLWKRRNTVAVSAEDANSNENFTGSIAYLDASSAWFIGGIFANYEYVFHKNWSARIGAGGGYAENISNGYGGILAAHYFTDGAHKFEASIGISYAGIVEYPLDGGVSPREWKISPAFSGGYRYQPPGRGMFFRVGVTYYTFGGGAHLGVGLRL